VSNAGHLPPTLLHRDGRCEQIEPPSGTALGITGAARFAIRRVLLKPGDGLLLITDGVTEAQNRDADFYGDDRLMESLRNMSRAENAGRVVSAVLDNIRTFSEGAPQFDDIAILCIRYLGWRAFSRSLEIGSAESPSRITQLLDEAESFLETSGLSEETVFDLRVVLDELLINILHHGSPQKGSVVKASLELVLEEEYLRATLTDSGPPFDPLKAPDTDSPKTTAELKIGGLGLRLARRLMDALDYKRLEDRNVLRMAKKIR